PAPDRPVVLLHILLVAGRHVAGALEQHAGRITGPQRATQRELKVLETLESRVAQVRRRTRILQHLWLGQVAQIGDRTIELRRWETLRRNVATQRLCVSKSLLCLAAELLRVSGREPDR